MTKFRAVVGLVGVPATNGRVLSAPAEGWQGEPVLPIHGALLGDRRPGGMYRVGWMLSVRMEDAHLVAEGSLDDTERGRDYAGALRLGVSRLVVDLAEGREEPAPGGAMGGRGALSIVDWRLRGLMAVRDAAWDLPLAEVFVG